jgi:hypothetical protein
MTMQKCIHPNCSRIVDEFGNAGKCIFHCEKDDWFVLQNEEKIWKEKNVTEFWIRIRKEKISKSDFNFFYYVFPEFEKYPKVEELKPNFDTHKIDRKLLSGIDKSKDPKILLLQEKKDGVNFWSKNSELNFINDVHFNGSRFLGKADFNYTNFNSKVSFLACSFLGEAFFWETSFNDVADFTATLFQDRVFFYKNQLTNTTIKFLDSRFKARFILKDLSSVNSILNFDHTHFLDDSIVFISNVNINVLLLNNLYNFSKSFRITKLTVFADFKILNTNLVNVEFNNVNFSKVPVITLKGTSFDNVRFNNINWGKTNLKRIKANRDILRQIKHQYDNQGNRIDANSFYSLEMNSYRLELLEKIKVSSDNNFIKRIWLLVKNLDFWIFNINYFSSNFSKNFLLPFVWLFILSGILYTFSFYKIDISRIESLKVFYTHIITSDWCLILNEIFNYMNPFDSGVKGPILVWIIHKSLSAYLIYQFVVSLRRQTKR